jgi:ribose transport system permease protein
MTIALISGGFDLSVGAILGLSGILTASFFDVGINIWVSAVFALIICMGFGAVNGLLIGKARINPLIVTLAMMTIVRGICYLITQGAPIKFYDAPPSFFQLGQGQFLGIPIFLIFCFALVIIFHILMVKSSPMRKIFYTGSNEKAAKVSGINTQWVKFAVYVISAALAGIAGLLSVSRFSVAIPYAGDGIEMKVIAAAVIGGANLSGGIGTVVGSLLGVILLSLITNALILLNVSVYWQSFISGLILLVAVLIDRFNRKV